MSKYLILILTAVNIYLFFSLKKERKRLRVLTSFVGGLMRFTSKIPSMIDEVVHKEVNPLNVNGYEVLLSSCVKTQRYFS
jgi:hypothetical protein